MDILNVRHLLRQKSIYEIPLRVTFYARVSTDSNEQLNSLNNQVTYYEDFIKQNSAWEYVPGYIDEGLSGISTKKRENFHRMVDDAKAGKFDLIVTKEISRFARNTLDSIQYTRDLLGAGVAVFFQNDGVNTLDEDSELRLSIMSSIAQDELRKLSSRVKFGHQQAIKDGVVLGNSRIFGYIKDKGRLVIDEQEAVMVRKLFELYATGNYSMKQIENIFWEDGYRNNHGKKISHTTMSSMISNPKYKGYYVGNKVKVIDMFTKKQKFLPPEEWVMFKDETGEIVPAIVSEELWEQANVVLRKRSEDVKNRQGKCNHQNLLTAKLYCMCCGAPYYRKDGKDRKGNLTSKWVCSGKIKNGAASCESIAIYEDEIKSLLLDVFQDTKLDAEALIKTYTDLYAEMTGDATLTKQIETQKKIIELAEQKKSKLLEYNVTGRISDADFIKMSDQCNVEIKKASEELKELEEQLFSGKEFQKHMDRIRVTLREAEKCAKTGVITRSFVDQYIDKIFVTIEEDGRIRLDVKIFTGETTEKYLHRFKVRTGHMSKNNTELVKLADLAALGFDSTKAVSYDQVLWFWIDSDLSSDQRLHIEMNGNIRTKIGAEIYSIQKNADGKAEIVAIPYQYGDTDDDGDTDGFTGLSFVHYTSAQPVNANNISRLKIAAGWSGWVGIPVEYFWRTDTQYVKEGDTINSISFQLYQNQGAIDAGTMAAGDALYLDEFWLTSKGTMPGLTDEELLWADADKVVTPDDGEEEETGYQYPLWNLDRVGEGLVDGAWSVAAHNSRHDMTASVVSNVGLNGSKALSVAVNNLYLKSGALDTKGDFKIVALTDLAALGFADNLTIQANDDILWFWVDSNMTPDARIQLELNGKTVRGNPLDTYYIYTICENAEGKPEMVKIMNGKQLDTVEGAGITLANQGSGNGNDASLIKFFGGWSGWIGIPMDQIKDAPLTAGSTLSKIGFFIRCQNAVDGHANLKVGDHFLFDEFWLTSANTMPKLLDWQLLGKEAPSKVYMDFDKANEAAKTDLANQSYISYNNPQVGDSVKLVAGKGYKESYALALGKNADCPANARYTGWTWINTAAEGAKDGLGITDVEFDSTAMLWVWIDATELTNGGRLAIAVGGSKHIFGGNSYYTLDENGELVPHTVVLQDTNNQSETTDASKKAAILVTGIKGWVGIPLSNFKGATEFGTIAMTLKGNSSSSKPMLANEHLYIGSFWIGEKVGDTWAIPTIAMADYN